MYVASPACCRSLLLFSHKEKIMKMPETREESQSGGRTEGVSMVLLLGVHYSFYCEVVSELDTHGRDTGHGTRAGRKEAAS